MHDKSTFLTICINGKIIISKAAVQLHKEFAWPILCHITLTLPLKQKKPLLRLITVTLFQNHFEALLAKKALVLTSLAGFV